MTFSANHAQIARDAMEAVSPDLVEAYVTVINFLADNPEAASAAGGRSSVQIGSDEYIRSRASTFAASREVKYPQPPQTVPDNAVSLIMETYFEIDHEELDRIKKEHSLSMGSENIVGDLLERYLATVLEPRGWVWCSGAMVKGADFIKSPTRINPNWRLLQIKNRDNSENSSSKAIRNGTIIEKWFRTFSRKEGHNWAAFPEPELRPLLSEEGFEAFIRRYIATLKNT